MKWNKITWNTNTQTDYSLNNLYFFSFSFSFSFPIVCAFVPHAHLCTLQHLVYANGKKLFVSLFCQECVAFFHNFLPSFYLIIPRWNYKIGVRPCVCMCLFLGSASNGCNVCLCMLYCHYPVFFLLRSMAWCLHEYRAMVSYLVHLQWEKTLEELVKSKINLNHR